MIVLLVGEDSSRQVVTKRSVVIGEAVVAGGSVVTVVAGGSVVTVVVGGSVVTVVVGGSVVTVVVGGSVVTVVVGGAVAVEGAVVAGGPVIPEGECIEGQSVNTYLIRSGFIYARLHVAGGYLWLKVT